MKVLFGYVVTGIRFGLFLKLLRRRRVSLCPIYIIRLFFILQNACWSSFFSIIEKRRFGKKINEYPVPKDPIIIIGHWRTGSTFLHKLLSLDDQFATPTLFQTSLPESFISARFYYAPLMKNLIGKKRPFDQTKAGIDEPQEDEFAIMRMSTESPLLDLMFPRSKGYFLLEKEHATEQPSELWQKSMDYFYRKVSWLSGKKLILKNPFHSMRIAYLKNHFPKAKFLHIYRNPLCVVPSSQKMWTVVGKQNAMNRNWRPPSIEEVTDFHSTMLDEIQNQLGSLEHGTYFEICYEDLERNPVTELRKAYAALGLEFTAIFEQRILEFLKECSNYEKNIYSLSEENKEYICSKMKASMVRYGYMGNGEGGIQ